MSYGKQGLVRNHIARVQHLRRQGTSFHHSVRVLANSPKHSAKLVTRGIVRSSPRGPTTAPRVKGSR